jgi:hypothetical protein
MNARNSIRTLGSDDADATRTVRIGLPPHVQERMRKLYGEPGMAALPDCPDDPGKGCIRTLAEWFSRRIGH